MRSYGKTLSLLMSVCFLAASATMAFAQTGKCAFQTLNIQMPANSFPSPEALTDTGAIVGTFLTPTRHSSGFLLYQGKITTFMFPGSTDTSAHDMSRTGTIVGEFNTGSAQRAFMVHSGGFHQITIPGFPNVPSVAHGVNDNGDVVGEFVAHSAQLGFLLHNGKLTILSFPGAQGGTVPESINDQGVIVGVYFSGPEDTGRGFMWKNGVFSNLNPPAAGNGHSFPRKISNAGDVVGEFTSPVDNLLHGFSFDKGRFTTIDASGFQQTSLGGVNKFDNVVAVGSNGTNNVQLKGFCSAVF
ncbi:MAG TPA: hypothetical protein VFB76_13305 [Candidatus Angelobacter sp.]|nr:hypothetical protein [Candidatus Angelobacter sp.]